ncbi:phasin family protein [Roseateles sp.]|jgi:poly(hydroxyalkanoate) granule-associated protein|uniref:phasin family protein n=1 Tax=Roseateles sp. TaxID=1971397 RepID=UPI0037C9A063
MVKKLQKMAAKQKATASSPIPGLPAGLLDGALGQSVRDSAHQIWAAGLGAFAKAQGEGGKVFDALVHEGMKLQKKTQSVAEEKIGAVAQKMSGMADEVGTKAGQHWDKLETIFEERVARALKRLGVPTAKDIDALIARIDALGGKVSAKPAASGAAKKKAAAKPAAKAAPKAAAKPAAKKASAKPAAKPAAKRAAPAKKAAPAAPAKKAAAPRKRAAASKPADQA